MKYQWNIFWAELNPAEGSEQAGRSPVLVVSEEVVNQSLPIVCIVPFTTYRLGRVIYPTEVLLQQADTQLAFPSVAMAHQLRTISKLRLKENAGGIQSEDIRGAIKNAMRIFLDLA
ncbi:type II toxin-antitoxin system PemK/MazF family toxin [bacterium]|nr:type II toxin-antitoxin system PemK/MazF family toxin [bacterium]